MSKVQVWFLCFLPCALSLINDGDVRLVGPNFTTPSLEGRVEIYHLGSWGTICDDHFGIEEANVVCRQLQYNLGAQYWYSNAYFGAGNGSIWLDDVNCIGNETALINCKHIGWNNHNCHHYEDVGVVCLKEGKYSTPGTCDFEKGHGMCGYQKVFEKSNFNWVFGTRNTGYNQWPKTDHTTAKLRGRGFYMTTFMKYWENVMQGQVARLQSPTIPSATCLEFYYFMGGTTVGELLVYLNTTTEKEKLVWQLIGDQGYEWKKGVIPIDNKYSNFNIIFHGVAGTGFYGNDVAIDDIRVFVATPANCTDLAPATANPTPQVTPTIAIRLVGSSVKSAGRVEVFHDSGFGGRWGTVCRGLYRRTFDIHAATVVCKELGYEGAEMVVPCCQVFGKGTGRIWLDNVKCQGDEASITLCSNSGWGNTYCTHNQDISVICRTNQTDRTEFEVRLGTEMTGVNYKGRVEVKIGGIWGTVSDRGWDSFDANVVCKQLHFAGAVGAYTGSNFGLGKGPIWMSNFQCKGNENSLAKCNHTNTEIQETWGHYRDASLECFDLRLNGGSNMSGRVEVMYSGRWGTVCNHNWDVHAANVVCCQLGYRRAEAVGIFGKGSGQIFLDNIQCKGSEPSLSFCRHSGWSAHDCTHDNDAGVVCTNKICGKSESCLNGGTCNEGSGLCNCPASFVGELCQQPAGLSPKNGDVRLVGPNFPAPSLEGRVEIYHLGSWGTICDDHFGIEEANVICRQLKYNLGAQYWYNNAYFGAGNGSIWLDDVNCIGNETALINCKHIGWNNHNCHHYEDVGVVCLKEGKYSTPGTCDFEKGHGMCGYQNVEKSNFNWTFGSRNTRRYQWPKTDHTTAKLRGKGFYMTTFLKFWEDIMQGQVARLQSPTIPSATCLEFYYFMGGTTVGELLVYLNTTTEKEKLVWQLIGDQGYEWKKGVIPIDKKYRNFSIIFEGVAGTGFYGSDVAIDDIHVYVTTLANCTFLPAIANPTPKVTPTSAIRLVGSSVKSAGRVEVFHDSGSGGKWGTVCNGYRKTFDIHAATVVCKELGYEGAEMVVPCCQVFGKGTGRIWLDNVKCLGREPSIALCSNSGWGNTYCTHDQDISVICKTKNTDRTEFEVRLGTEMTRVNYKGRVEVKIGGIWGTVTDRAWDSFDANVVCKQLHFAGAVGAYTGSNFGLGKGPIWMSYFQCKGNENSLAKCNHSNTEVQEKWGHYRDASVECFDLRLANGGSNMSGRVEVMYSGRWGTVCNHNWDVNAANVVCRQLGYRRAEAVGFFGKGFGQIFLDKVRCEGSEPSLAFCYHSGWYAAKNCTHDNDAGVVCTNRICSKSQSCLNGGTCNEGSGLCNCPASFVGEICQLPAENETVEIVFDGKLKQWNETWFKHILVKDLNAYCSKVKCSTTLSKGQNVQLTFEDEDIKIIEPAKQQDQGVMVGFVVLYTDGKNTKVMPKSFMHNFINSKGGYLAGYKVNMVDGQKESPPAGHHSAPQQNSKSKYIYIGVGVAVALVAVLVLVFLVKRYGKRPGHKGGDNRYSDRRYLALHADDYDDSMDDSALLRPPQEPSREGDLMS